MAAPTKKPKKRLVSMDTEEVSIVNAGANGHSQWLIVKNEDGKNITQGIPVETATDEIKKQALDARSEKYGIEKLSGDGNLTIREGMPSAESMYGDPVNLRYPICDAENLYSSDIMKSSIRQFEKETDLYTDASKKRILERLFRRGIAKGFNFDDVQNKTFSELLPDDLKHRISKRNNDEPESQNDQEHVETSAENRTKSDQDTNLVTDLGITLEYSRRAIAMSKSTTGVKRLRMEVDRALKKASEFRQNVDASNSQTYGVGNEDSPYRESERYKKTASDKDKRIELLTKQLNRANAEKSRRRTAIGTSQALRTMETRKNSGDELQRSSVQDYIDMSPPLEDNRS